jgi:hypothetical protein
MKPEYEIMTSKENQKNSIEKPLNIDDLLKINCLSKKEQEDIDSVFYEAINQFFANNFDESEKTFTNSKDTNPLGSFGAGALMFVKAIIAFEEKEFDFMI